MVVFTLGITFRGDSYVRLLVSAQSAIYIPPTPTFNDVPTDHPFYQWIETASLHSIISGYADGTFHPGGSATRGQIAKIVYGAITGDR